LVHAHAPRGVRKYPLSKVLSPNPIYWLNNPVAPDGPGMLRTVKVSKMAARVNRFILIKALFSDHMPGSDPSSESLRVLVL